MNLFYKQYGNNNKFEPSKNLASKKTNKELINNKDKLKKISEKIFNDLYLTLNKKHKVNFSRSFWRVYLYPWISYFVFIIFDRYNLVIINSKKNVGFKKKIDFTEIVFNESNDFCQNYSNDKKTNFILCNLIFNIIKKKNINYNIRSGKKKNKVFLDDSKKNSMLEHLLIFFYKFFFIKKYVIRAFSFKSVLLNFFYYRALVIPKINLTGNKEVDHDFRESCKLNLNSNDRFVLVIKSLLPHLMPKSFVEDFLDLKNKVKKIYPTRIREIYSDSALLRDDTHRMWVSISKSKNTKLSFFQHGGAYSDRFNSSTETEYSLSDQHLIFARSLIKKEKQYTDKIFLRIKDINVPINNKILIPISYVTNFNQHYQFPTCSDYAHYYNQIFSFIENLNKDIQKKIVLRLMPNTKEHNSFSKIIKKKFPNIEVEKPNDNIIKSLKEYSFFVGTINSTTILQAILSGIPFILFLNKNYFLPKKKYVKYYNLLQKNKLMFNDGKSAAFFLNKKFDDRKKWYNKELSNIRKFFIRGMIYSNYV